MVSGHYSMINAYAYVNILSTENSDYLTTKLVSTNFTGHASAYHSVNQLLTIMLALLTKLLANFNKHVIRIGATKRWIK